MNGTNTAERDLALLDTVQEGREAAIADAATRAAYRRVADWLSSKQMKAADYPGGNPVHAAGRANAYGNAAEHVYALERRHASENA